MPVAMTTSRHHNGATGGCHPIKMAKTMSAKSAILTIAGGRPWCTTIATREKLTIPFEVLQSASKGKPESSSTSSCRPRPGMGRAGKRPLLSNSGCPVPATSMLYGPA